jgi:UV excision repair protein RAD23
MDAINRLTQLGFPKSRAAEAFFACDKNEEMAANFLLESGYEDEDVATQQAI